MVVKLRPAAAEHGIWHARTAFPFSSTVHAPQTPTPQPNFVPVNPRLSRMSQSNGVSSSASTTCLAPLTVKSILLTTDHGSASIPDTNTDGRVQNFAANFADKSIQTEFAPTVSIAKSRQRAEYSAAQRGTLHICLEW